MTPTLTAARSAHLAGLNAFQVFGTFDPSKYTRLQDGRARSPGGRVLSKQQFDTAVQRYQQEQQAGPRQKAGARLPGPKVPDERIRQAVGEETFGKFQKGELTRKQVLARARKSPHWNAPPAVKQAAEQAVPQVVEQAAGQEPPAVKQTLAAGLAAAASAATPEAGVSAVTSWVKGVFRLPAQVGARVIGALFKTLGWIGRKTGVLGRVALGAGGMYGGAWAGAQVGSLFGPLGTAIGTGIGGAVGALAGRGDVDGLKRLVTLRGAVGTGSAGGSAVRGVLSHLGNLALFAGGIAAPLFFPMAMHDSELVRSVVGEGGLTWLKGAYTYLRDNWFAGGVAPETATDMFFGGISLALGGAAALRVRRGILRVGERLARVEQPDLPVVYDTAGRVERPPGELDLDPHDDLTRHMRKAAYGFAEIDRFGWQDWKPNPAGTHMVSPGGRSLTNATFQKLSGGKAPAKPGRTPAGKTPAPPAKAAPKKVTPKAAGRPLTRAAQTRAGLAQFDADAQVRQALTAGTAAHLARLDLPYVQAVAKQLLGAPVKGRKADVLARLEQAVKAVAPSYQGARDLPPTAPRPAPTVIGGPKRASQIGAGADPSKTRDQHWAAVARERDHLRGLVGRFRQQTAGAPAGPRVDVGMIRESARRLRRSQRAFAAAAAAAPTPPAVTQAMGRARRPVVRAAVWVAHKLSDLVTWLDRRVMPAAAGSLAGLGAAVGGTVAGAKLGMLFGPLGLAVGTTIGGGLGLLAARAVAKPAARLGAALLRDDVSAGKRAAAVARRPLLRAGNVAGKVAGGAVAGVAGAAGAMTGPVTIPAALALSPFLGLRRAAKVVDAPTDGLMEIADVVHNALSRRGSKATERKRAGQELVLPHGGRRRWTVGYPGGGRLPKRLWAGGRVVAKQSERFAEPADVAELRSLLEAAGVAAPFTDADLRLILAAVGRASGGAPAAATFREFETFAFDPNNYVRTPTGSYRHKGGRRHLSAAQFQAAVARMKTPGEAKKAPAAVAPAAPNGTPPAAANPQPTAANPPKPTAASTARYVASLPLRANRLLGRGAAAAMTGLVAIPARSKLGQAVGSLWDKAMTALFGRRVDGKREGANRLQNLGTKYLYRPVGSALTGVGRTLLRVRNGFRQGLLQGVAGIPKAVVQRVFKLFDAQFRANVKKLGGGPMAVLKATAIELTAGVFDWTRATVVNRIPVLGRPLNWAIAGALGKNASARAWLMAPTERRLRRVSSPVRERRKAGQVLVLGPQGGRANVSARDGWATLAGVTPMVQWVTGNRDLQYDPNRRMADPVNREFLAAAKRVTPRAKWPDLVRAAAVLSNYKSFRRDRPAAAADLIGVLRRQAPGRRFSEGADPADVAEMVAGVRELLAAGGVPADDRAVLVALGGVLARLAEGDGDAGVQTFGWDDWQPDGGTHMRSPGGRRLSNAVFQKLSKGAATPKVATATPKVADPVTRGVTPVTNRVTPPSPRDRRQLEQRLKQIRQAKDAAFDTAIYDKGKSLAKLEAEEAVLLAKLNPPKPATTAVVPPTKPAVPPLTGTAAATYARAQAEYPAFRDRYLTDHGTTKNGQLVGVTLNTDEWRGYFPEYTGTNAADTHEAASYLNDRLFQEALTQLKGTGNKRLVVLAGGGGSGKGSAGRLLPLDDYPIRLDQVSGDFDKLMKKFDQGKANGFQPEYTFIDRSPEQAWAGVVGRAVSGRKKGGVARTVPLEIALRANLDARAVALRVLRERPDIPAAVIDNNGRPGDARMITDRQQAIRHLERQSHDYQALLEKLRRDTLANPDLDPDIRAGLVPGAGPAAAVPPRLAAGDAGAGRTADAGRTGVSGVRRQREAADRQLTAGELTAARKVERALAKAPAGGSLSVAELRAASGLDPAAFNRLALKLHAGGAVKLLDDGTTTGETVRTAANRRFARVRPADPKAGQSVAQLIRRQRADGRFSERRLRYFPVC